MKNLRNRLFPPGSRRGIVGWCARRFFQILFADGPFTLVKKCIHKSRQIWRGQKIWLRAPDQWGEGSQALRYIRWQKRNRPTPERLAELKERLASTSSRVTISIVVWEDEEDALGLKRTRESIEDQVCPAHEVVQIANGLPFGKRIQSALADITGDYVGFLVSGNRLAPHAVGEYMLRLTEAADARPDIIYGDEDWQSSNTEKTVPIFKPVWSPELLLTFNYVGRGVLFRKEFLIQLFNDVPSKNLVSEHDLILAASENDPRVERIPDILLHQGNATATESTGEERVACTKRALIRRGVNCCVSMLHNHLVSVRYELATKPLISIIIPTRDRRNLLESCIQSIESKTSYSNYEIIIVDNGSEEPMALDYLDELSNRWKVIRDPAPFNYSALNNKGASQANGEFLLFLNNDIEVITVDWLEALLEQGQREKVGVVGAKLLYPDDRIQHAGVVLGMFGGVGHSFNGIANNTENYLNLADHVRECSAVTGACMLVKRSVFEEVGGMDEDLKVAFNDIDLCLKIIDKGFEILYTPHALLTHHECASRGLGWQPDDETLFWDRWGERISAGDPYYNPNLTLNGADWAVQVT